MKRIFILLLLIAIIYSALGISLYIAEASQNLVFLPVIYQQKHILGTPVAVERTPTPTPHSR